MKKLLVSTVVVYFLTGCGGVTCTGGPMPHYSGFSSAWVASDLSPVIDSSSGGPILTDRELNLAQPQAADSVAVAVAGELEWHVGALQAGASTENLWSGINFSVVQQANACSPGVPSVINTISSITVRIASITNSNLEPGADVSALFTVVASNKRHSPSMPLYEWNAINEYEFFPLGLSDTRDNAVYLRFADPNQFSGTSVTFDLHFELREGETFDITTDEIAFYN